MTLETSIARAIQRDLDIIEALPAIHEVPMEQVEGVVEEYVSRMHEHLSLIVRERGDTYLRARDAAGLCATCLDAGVNLPPRMLLRMCQTIIELSGVNATFILDTDAGASLYYMRLSLTA
jgi:hypothetical protein